MKIVGYLIYGAVMIGLIAAYIVLGPNPALYEALYANRHYQ